MHMNHRIPAVLGAALVLFTGAALAQEPVKSLACKQSDGGDSRQQRACEMREMTLPATGSLNVDAAPNGGITVKAWSKGEILLRAKVETWGDTKSEAESRLKEVKIATGAKVSADGPRTAGRSYYSVSYEVFVPSKIDLTLQTTNGGVNITGVNGAIVANTTNGGLKLSNLAGKVSAHTTNGGVKVELAGSTWQGEGFDVSTTNGGVNIDVPADYSARLEARTTNGGVRSDLPMTIQGNHSGKRVNATLGKGGALVKVETTNGGISLNKAGA
jgi:hypothetical protein